MTDDLVFQAIRRAVLDVSGLDINDSQFHRPGQSWRDLDFADDCGLDTLDAIEIEIAVEDALGVEVPTLGDALLTLGALANAIEAARRTA